MRIASSIEPGRITKGCNVCVEESDSNFERIHWGALSYLWFSVIC